jgi:hypothetical protein
MTSSVIFSINRFVPRALCVLVLENSHSTENERGINHCNAKAINKGRRGSVCVYCPIWQRTRHYFHTRCALVQSHSNTAHTPSEAFRAAHHQYANHSHSLEHTADAINSLFFVLFRAGFMARITHLCQNTPAIKQLVMLLCVCQQRYYLQFYKHFWNFQHRSTFLWCSAKGALMIIWSRDEGRDDNIQYYLSCNFFV